MTATDAAARQRARDRAADGYLPQPYVSAATGRARTLERYRPGGHGIHGRISTYTRGCRCEPCRTVKSAANRKHWAARKADR